MATPFIGEIRIFAGPYAPYNWAMCDGQDLSIAQNLALFKVLGIAYGGDGVVTFRLPDLRGRAAIGSGTGTGLTKRQPGDSVGSESVAITGPEALGHSHTVMAFHLFAGNRPSPEDNSFSRVSGTSAYVDPVNLTPLHENTVPTGGGGGIDAHPNMQPYITLNFIIALVGDYPN